MTVSVVLDGVSVVIELLEYVVPLNVNPPLVELVPKSANLLLVKNKFLSSQTPQFSNCTRCRLHLSLCSSRHTSPFTQSCHSVCTCNTRQPKSSWVSQDQLVKIVWNCKVITSVCVLVGRSTKCPPNSATASFPDLFWTDNNFYCTSRTH